MARWRRVPGCHSWCDAVSLTRETLYEHAGGHEGLRRFIDIFCSSVLADAMLQPLFRGGTSGARCPPETFGGPDVFTREMGGFPRLIEAHRGLKITDAQRRRFVALCLAAADAAGLPDDAPFRESLRTHVEFGSQVAMQNSPAETEDQLHPFREVPRWQVARQHRHWGTLIDACSLETVSMTGP